MSTAEFTEDTLRRAFIRCRGICECSDDAHDHLLSQCHIRVDWAKRGTSGEGGWEALAIDPDEIGGAGNPDNCLILCWECYRRTERIR